MIATFHFRRNLICAEALIVLDFRRAGASAALYNPCSRVESDVEFFSRLYPGFFADLLGGDFDGAAIIRRHPLVSPCSRRDSPSARLRSKRPPRNSGGSIFSRKPNSPGRVVRYVAARASRRLLTQQLSPYDLAWPSGMAL